MNTLIINTTDPNYVSVLVENENFIEKHFPVKREINTNDGSNFNIRLQCEVRGMLNNIVKKLNDIDFDLSNITSISYDGSISRPSFKLGFLSYDRI